MKHQCAVVAAQLAGLVASMAAIIAVILAALTFLANECAGGTPRLTTIFPCFRAQ
jgi:hypothetical protein